MPHKNNNVPFKFVFFFFFFNFHTKTDNGHTNVTPMEFINNLFLSTILHKSMFTTHITRIYIYIEKKSRQDIVNRKL